MILVFPATGISFAATTVPRQIPLYTRPYAPWPIILILSNVLGSARTHNNNYTYCIIGSIVKNLNHPLLEVRFSFIFCVSASIQHNFSSPIKLMIITNVTLFSHVASYHSVSSPLL